MHIHIHVIITGDLESIMYGCYVFGYDITIVFDCDMIRYAYAYAYSYAHTYAHTYAHAHRYAYTDTHYEQRRP